jgi:hypothetical protein
MNNPKFESCFTGLDLSEFGSEKNQSSIISASAQLIQVKKEESRRKQNEEEEEALVTIKAARRAQDHLQRLERDEKQGDEKAGGIFGALISMHGTDHSGGKREKSGAKTKAQKRTTMSKFKSSTSRISKKKKQKSKRS